MPHSLSRMKSHLPLFLESLEVEDCLGVKVKIRKLLLRKCTTVPTYIVISWCWFMESRLRFWASKQQFHEHNVCLPTTYVPYCWHHISYHILIPLSDLIMFVPLLCLPNELNWNEYVIIMIVKMNQ